MSTAEINRKLDLHTRLLARLLNHVGDNHMALSADVQRLIDQVAANRSLAQSANQALGVMEQQIKNLNEQIASIQPGQPIDAEDLAAIKKAAQDLTDTNTGLQAAVPANVNSGGVDANGNPVTPGQPTAPASPGPNAPGNPSTDAAGQPLPSSQGNGPTTDPSASPPTPDKPAA